MPNHKTRALTEAEQSLVTAVLYRWTNWEGASKELAFYGIDPKKLVGPQAISVEEVPSE